MLFVVVLSVLVPPVWLLLLLLFCFLCVLIPSAGFSGNFFFLTLWRYLLIEWSKPYHERKRVKRNQSSLRMKEVQKNSPVNFTAGNLLIRSCYSSKYLSEKYVQFPLSPWKAWKQLPWKQNIKAPLWKLSRNVLFRSQHHDLKLFWLFTRYVCNITSP